MRLEHSFTVPAKIDQAWLVLLDIERIAPCLPGAVIDSVDGDDFTGSVKVRLGPIGLTYKGKASFVAKDEAAHRAVIDAQGKDARGNGTANATITATLTQDGANTRVQVLTELNITGKPAQFGRGVLVDVGNKLIGQFADCLAGKLTETEIEPAAEPAEIGSEPAAAAPGTLTQPSDDRPPGDRPPAAAPLAAEPAEQAPPVRPAVSTGRPAAQHAAPPAEAEPIDLLGSAGPAVAKRLAPVLLLVVALLVLLVRRRRRSCGHR